MTFRTLKLSTPEYEFPGVRQLTVKSRAIKGRIDVSIYIPEVARNATNLPVIMLLHGVYSSHWSWMMQGGAHHVLERMIRAGQSSPFVLVMPSDGLWGDGSGYVAHHGLDFEHLISSEVPAAVEMSIDQVSPQSRWYIAGLSMGGYGALSLGLKHAQKFRAISAHSPITDYNDFLTFVEEDWDSDAETHFHSISGLAKKTEGVPPTRIDCGKDDPLMPSNQRLHQALNELGIAHQFEEREGQHNWPYWNLAIERTFLFFTNQE